MMGSIRPMSDGGGVNCSRGEFWLFRPLAVLFLLDSVSDDVAKLIYVLLVTGYICNVAQRHSG